MQLLHARKARPAAPVAFLPHVEGAEGGSSDSLALERDIGNHQRLISADSSSKRRRGSVWPVDFPCCRWPGLYRRHQIKWCILAAGSLFLLGLLVLLLLPPPCALPTDSFCLATLPSWKELTEETDAQATAATAAPGSTIRPTQVDVVTTAARASCVSVVALRSVLQSVKPRRLLLIAPTESQCNELLRHLPAALRPPVECWLDEQLLPELSIDTIQHFLLTKLRRVKQPGATLDESFMVCPTRSLLKHT